MNRLITFCLCFILLSSCEEEPAPVPVDIRDELVGRYMYLPFYYFDNLEPNEFANRLQDVRYAIEFKKTDAPESFDLTFDASGTTLHCHSLSKSTNGYTFTIENQTVTFNDINTYLSALTIVEVDGVMHQAEIDVTEKRIHFFIRSESPTTTYFPMILEIDARRSE